MSAFEWNKVIGAILVALLVIKAADIAGDMILHAEEPEQHAYAIAGVEQAPAAGGEAKKEPAQVADIAGLLKTADAAAGEKAARKCATCHTFDKGGPNRVGPNLHGVVGQDVAQGSFAFSPALQKVEGAWDYKKLNEFLANPRGFAPGTKMAFAGIKDDKERAAVIAYLRSLSDNPPPLP